MVSGCARGGRYRGPLPANRRCARAARPGDRSFRPFLPSHLWLRAVREESRPAGRGLPSSAAGCPSPRSRPGRGVPGAPVGPADPSPACVTRPRRSPRRPGLAAAAAGGVAPRRAAAAPREPPLGGAGWPNCRGRGAENRRFGVSNVVHGSRHGTFPCSSSVRTRPRQYGVQS